MGARRQAFLWNGRLTPGRDDKIGAAFKKELQTQ